ncbi:hypothetical protein V8C35DRAFT_285739 [Trichoderma chlorosporum]
MLPQTDVIHPGSPHASRVHTSTIYTWCCGIHKTCYLPSASSARLTWIRPAKRPFDLPIGRMRNPLVPWPLWFGWREAGQLTHEKGSDERSQPHANTGCGPWSMQPTKVPVTYNIPACCPEPRPDRKFGVHVPQGETPSRTAKRRGRARTRTGEMGIGLCFRRPLVLSSIGAGTLTRFPSRIWTDAR